MLFKGRRKIVVFKEKKKMFLRKEFDGEFVEMMVSLVKGKVRYMFLKFWGKLLLKGYKIVFW